MYLHLSKPTKNFTQKGPKQTLPATEVVIDGMKLTTSDKNNNNYRTFTFVWTFQQNSDMQSSRYHYCEHDQLPLMKWMH